MGSEATGYARGCWCGNAVLSEFSDGYDACADCGTLVSRHGLRPEETQVRDDDSDFYGRTYWLSRQRDELGFPDIYERARADLPERCLRWLRTLLGYALPPARVLEIGSGHGGFVALMRAAGFEATGLEVSPWVANFARTAFGVPTLVGPLENQSLSGQSMDVVVVNDVLEHLTDPVSTLRLGANLLAADGFMHVQTPCYPEGQSHQQLIETNHPFLAMLQEREHLYLFSRRAVRRFFANLGLPILRFEAALFPYDMVVLASRHELTPTDPRHRDETLLASPAARTVRAMLDLDDRISQFSRRVVEIEADRTERLAMIERLNRHIQDVSHDDEVRRRVIADQQATIEDVNRRLAELSQDYEARRRVIADQQATIEDVNRQLAELSRDYQARGEAIRERQTALDRIESDRQERLAMIERLNAHIAKTSADYETRGQVIHEQQATVQRLTRELETRAHDEAERARTLDKLRNALADAGRQAVQLAAEGESQRRLIADREDLLARLRAETEAQVRVIADQHATIDKLIHLRDYPPDAESRFRDMDTVQHALSTLLQSRLIRFLRALRLV
jgi:2-polyprenyl-3-methyl-5-hydroxy-6-metoxy-1,4-benzoquinol methylase